MILYMVFEIEIKIGLIFIIRQYLNKFVEWDFRNIHFFIFLNFYFYGQHAVRLTHSLDRS